MAAVDSEIQELLSALSEKVTRRVAAKVKEQADRLADAIKDELRSLLQPPEETGKLEESVRVEDGAHELEKVVCAGGPTTTEKTFDRALGFEFGTSRQPARPFFYSTVRRMRSDIEQELQQAVEEAIK